MEPVTGDVARWWSEGGRLPAVTATGGTVELFVRDVGVGPVVTLLHGYPSSSFDWAEVARDLAVDHRVVTPDLLGFGASDKPTGHRWSVGEQVDLLLQLWQALGVTRTALVAHDYSASVAQELLARVDGPTRTPVVLCNGGVYPALHRPTDGQLLLRSPGGDDLAAAVDRELFAAGLQVTFGSDAPATTRQVDDMWACVSRDHGQRLLGELLHYMDDRVVHADRWTGAMESTETPLTFVWGLDDPVSGAHMLAEIDRRVPGAAMVPLAGVGHWPMLEAPERVTTAVRRALSGSCG